MPDFVQGLVMILAIGGIFLYFPTNRVQAPGRWFFQDSWLDEHVPLVPSFVVAYVALFPYIVATLILVLGTPFALEAYTAVAIAAWSAALFWYFFPAGIARKREIGPDFFSRMIVWLYEHDQENNTIPSSHVFYALMCSYYLALVFPSLAILFAIIGGMISVSTVFVKQHHLADILGGIVWAVASIAVAHWLIAG